MAAIQSSRSRCRSGRSSGLRHGAQRASRSALAVPVESRRCRPRSRPFLWVAPDARAARHASVLTGASALLAHWTMWKGSAHCTAAGHRMVMTSLMPGAAGAFWDSIRRAAGVTRLFAQGRWDRVVAGAR